MCAEKAELSDSYSFIRSLMKQLKGNPRPVTLPAGPFLPTPLPCNLEYLLHESRLAVESPSCKSFEALTSESSC